MSDDRSGNRTSSGPEDFDPNASHCPNCGAKWHTTEIPDHPGEFYSNLMGRYDLGRDRTVAWVCPSCQKEWPR